MYRRYITRIFLRSDEETIEPKRQRERERERGLDLPHRSVERVNGGREEDVGWNGRARRRTVARSQISRRPFPRFEVSRS